MQLNSGVYIISYNNKNYVGSSSNLKKRIREHFNCLKRNAHPNSRLQRAYNKYGVDVFLYKIVATCPSEYLLKLEQWFINNLKPELNLAEIVGRPPANRKRGYKMSEEAKQNISKARTGQKIDRSNYVHSEETLNKISQSLKGRVITEAWKQKMREAKANGGKYSKLNVEQVKEIKLLVGTKTDKEISEIFNCSRATINQIKNNKIWKEI